MTGKKKKNKQDDRTENEAADKGFLEPIIAWAVLELTPDASGKRDYMTVVITSITSRTLLPGERIVGVVPAEPGWVGHWTSEGEFLGTHFVPRVGAGEEEQYEPAPLPKDRKGARLGGYM